MKWLNLSDMDPLTGKDLLRRKIAILSDSMDRCMLCPRRCGVDRRGGERGFCNLSELPLIASSLPHFGEEPPLAAGGGAGTIFFASCNLRCLYCQNYQISQEGLGRTMSSEELSEVIMGLQAQGCENIEAVTATPHLYGFLEAFLLSMDKGLSLPLIYNSGGYEDTDVLRILEGVVDIYLPDLKYGNDIKAKSFSGASNYLGYAIPAIKEMVRQVGDDIVTDGDKARRGIIIRHLVLPGMKADSFEVLRLIRRHVSTRVPISIMAQYTPTPSVQGHPELGRRVSRSEYDSVVNRALDMGFENIFVQDPESDGGGMPDFKRNTPFIWKA